MLVVDYSSNVAYFEVVVDVYFLFGVKIKPNNIIKGCNHHNSLVVVENYKLWLAIQVRTEIKIRLNLCADMVVAEDLGVIREKNLVYILVIEFNFPSNGNEPLRHNTGIFEFEVLVFFVLLIDDQVFNVVLTVLQPMAHQYCKISLALAEFDVQNFVLHALFVKSNVCFYSVNLLQIFVLVNDDALLLCQDEALHCLTIDRKAI